MNEKNNTGKAIKVLWIVMAMNLGVAILKIIIGTIAQSGSIVADGFHSLSDGSGNIVGIIGLSIAGRPHDDSHPYGHKKFETLSSLLIGVLLFLVASKVLYNAITGAMHPVKPEFTPLSFIVMITTLVVNIFVVRYESKKGTQLGSDVLKADSEHTKSDIAITLGVILTMVLIMLGVPPIIDSFVSFIISILIYKASYEVFFEASQTLSDAAVLSADEISAVVMACDGVLSCHKIRSRGRKDDIHIDLHIHVDANMNVMQAHELQHRVEQQLKAKFGECVSAITHVEPFGQR